MPEPSPTSSSGLGPFLAELRRRHVGRATLAYAAVVFVLLQTAEIVLPAFLPGFQAEAVLRILVVTSALLLPVVLALAWVYEITPQGIRTMAEIDAERGEDEVGAGRIFPRVALLLVTAVAAGGAGLWWYRTDTSAARPSDYPQRSTPFISASTTDASGPIASLAVLPLENFSPGAEGEQDYFVAGMHEALISQLSQLGTFRVISRTSAAQYDREGKSVPQIGSELGVDAVVEGSVLRADGKVRITVQLVHAASDTHLLARDYERDFADLIALQREVAEAIAAEIGTRLAEREADESGATGPEVLAEGATEPSLDPARSVASAEIPPIPAVPVAPEVQDAFMRGRFALSQDSDEGMDEAMDQFHHALEMDSAFTPALVGLAGGHLLMGLKGEENSLSELLEAHRLARAAAQREPASAEAREVLASVEQAIASYGEHMSTETRSRVSSTMRVVALSGDSMLVVMEGDSMRVPRVNVAPVLTEFGGMLQSVLARDEARVGPVDGWLRGIRRLEGAGRIDQALALAQEAASHAPEAEPVLVELERLQATTGRIQEAVETRKLRVERLGPSSGPTVEALEERLRRDPRRGYWEWLLDDLRGRRESRDTTSSFVHEAEALAALGRRGDALDALERARSVGDPRLVSVRANPVWDPLRSDDRFRAFVRSLVPARAPGERSPPVEP